MKLPLNSALSVSLVLAASLAAGCSSTSSTKSALAAAQGGDAAMPIPPGWTAEEMQTCMVAGLPGEQHSQLAQHAGRWAGTSTMWMTPGSPPMSSTCTAQATVVMGGRFLQLDYAGEMPGMGTFEGRGYFGYDNVAEQHVASWISNHGSNIMNGTGLKSADGKSMTWTYSYLCPLTKRTTTMREIEHRPDADTMTLETHMKDPKSGQEYKAMWIEMKRVGS
jgi:hypothetical protein